MIVRTILDAPKQCDNFDFFNDFSNTMDWLSGLGDTRADEAKARLDQAHWLWLNQDRLNQDRLIKNTPSINQQLFDNLKAVVECGLLASFDDQVEILIKAQALVRNIEGARNATNPPA